MKPRNFAAMLENKAKIGWNLVAKRGTCDPNFKIQNNQRTQLESNIQPQKQTTRNDQLNVSRLIVITLDNPRILTTLALYQTLTTRDVL